jgi:hypothetical protein
MLSNSASWNCDTFCVLLYALLWEDSIVVVLLRLNFNLMMSSKPAKRPRPRINWPLLFVLFGDDFRDRQVGYDIRCCSKVKFWQDQSLGDSFPDVKGQNVFQLSRSCEGGVTGWIDDTCFMFSSDLKFSSMCVPSSFAERTLSMAVMLINAQVSF